MLKRVLRLMEKEFLEIFRNPLVLVILVGAPIVLTFLFGSIYMKHKVTEIPLAVVDYDGSQLSRTIAQFYDETEEFDIVKSLSSEKEIEELIQKGEIEGALIFPKDLSKNIKAGKASEVALVVNGTNMIISNTILSYSTQILGTVGTGAEIQMLQAAGQKTDQAMDVAMPIKINYRRWYNPTNSYSNFLLLGLIMIAIQQVNMMYCAKSIVKERVTKTLHRLFISKVGTFEILLGKTLPYIIIGFTEIILSLIIANKLFAMPIYGDPLVVIILAFAFVCAVVAYGVLFSVISPSEMFAMELAMVISTPSFLISGYTWPLSAMPEFIRAIAYVLPMTHYVSALRPVIFMNAPLSVIKKEIIILSAMTLILWSVAYLVLAHQRRRFFREENTCPGNTKKEIKGGVFLKQPGRFFQKKDMKKPQLTK